MKTILPLKKQREALRSIQLFENEVNQLTVIFGDMDQIESFHFNQLKGNVQSVKYLLNQCLILDVKEYDFEQSITEKLGWITVHLRYLVPDTPMTEGFVRDIWTAVHDATGSVFDCWN